MPTIWTLYWLMGFCGWLTGWHKPTANIVDSWFMVRAENNIFCSNYNLMLNPSQVDDLIVQIQSDNGDKKIFQKSQVLECERLCVGLLKGGKSAEDG